MAEKGTKPSVSVGPHLVVGDGFKLLLPRRDAATVNGSRILSMADKIGSSAMSIPIINGSGQLGGTSTVNVIMDTNPLNWQIPTGSLPVDGVTILPGGVLRLTKPGYYDIQTRFTFSQTTATNVIAFVNGTELDSHSVSTTNIVSGGATASLKHSFRLVYGPGNTGNIDVTFALQATNVVGNEVSPYTFSYLYIVKYEHLLTV